jgi:putative DNA primase/helicase
VPDGKPPRLAPTSSRDDYYAGLLAYPSSDLGIGDIVKFDHSTGKWHIWNGVRWEPDKDDKIIDMIRNCLFDWIADNDRNGHADANKTLLPLLDYGRKQQVLKALASMRGIAMSGDEWDADPFLIGFENGVMDLRTGVLDEHPSPDTMVSKSTGIVWDQNADMSPFLDFITEIMSGDHDVSNYLLNVLGYSLIGVNQEQKFWMWVGRGSNGKGILARTVTKALGDYAYSPPDTLYMRTKVGAATSNTPRPELLKLKSMRFTFMSEPQGGQFNEELLKAHTGNDPIEARNLYSTRFMTFTPSHKINFLTNEPPRTDDVGPSMQRRVRIIKFQEDYSPGSGREDNTLEGRLQTPEGLQGVMRALVEYAKDYLKTSLLPEPQAVTNWSRAYIADNDPITAFLSAKCVEEPDAEAKGGELYKSFSQFCADGGYEDMSMTPFGRHMASRFVKKVRSAGSFYLGVRLKNSTDWASETEDAE